VKHIKSALYHPSMNGMAEHFVQSFKKAMMSSDSQPYPLEQRLANFCYSTSTTVHPTTNATPFILLMNHSLCTRLDLLRPNVEGRVTEQQAKHKESHDARSRDRQFFVGQRVMARNLQPGPKWIPGTVIERNGPLSYLVKVRGEQVWKRHVDMLCEVSDTPMEESVEASNQSDEVEEPISPPTVETESSNNSQNQSATESQPGEQNHPTTDADSRVAQDVTEGTNEHFAAAPRYPRREHRLPKHYRTDIRHI